MTTKKDYYDILGVPRNVSEAELKKAFRRKAMKYHPDRNPENKEEAEAKFKELNEAYDVLSNSQKRAAYDQFGHAGVDPSAAGAQGFGGGFGQGDLGDIFGDIFGDMFGGARGARGQAGAQVHPGNDLLYNLELNLEDAVHGKTVEIRVPSFVACETCSGSGAKAGSKPEKCPSCEGHGQVRMQRGFFTVQQTCPDCHGVGTVIKDPCPDCRGQGRKQKTQTLSVKVPAGVDEGDRIRLAGKGEAGMAGAPPGDLYVQIHLKQHPIFVRQGNDLHCEVPISFIMASLGGELEIPTIDGRVKLKIPAGTQSGKQFRLRAQGVKQVRGNRVGDLFCHVIVETPVNLSAEQKELLEKLDASLKAGGSKHSPKSKSWFDGVKRFFEGLAG